ncbi:hypothetical protein KSP40_PGU018003 [Platanthera guangdongensis]|uniref:protein-ribulosamine 3-kinase n=1 Tax=Platanthera guangdongensis TaxID=2320717 RepID=A0ABR2MMA5_9ASPA
MFIFSPQPDHEIHGVDPILVAAMPTIKYCREAFHSKEDAQSKWVFQAWAIRAPKGSEILGQSLHRQNQWCTRETIPCFLARFSTVAGDASASQTLDRKPSRTVQMLQLVQCVASSNDDPIREWILTEGKATQITRIAPIGGGCINRANRYDTDNGAFFVKTNGYPEIGPSMFEGEAVGLSAMYSTKSIRIPRPFKFGSLPRGGSFIIMEFVEFGSYREIQSVLGRRLAEMHKAGKSEKGFGFDVNNTIGSTPQINSWSSDWVEFFSEHRLGYQLKLALQRFGDSDIYEKGQQLIKSMKPLFEGHSVVEIVTVHGGSRATNIRWATSFTGLCRNPRFFGFKTLPSLYTFQERGKNYFFSFYYEQVMPEQPGFERRKELYMLYHYLNHYNLFGYGYRSSAMSIIDSYLRMLKP